MSKTDTQKTLYDVNGALSYLEGRGYPMSQQYFYRVVHDGRIPAAIDRPRYMRWLFEDLKAYADERDESKRLDRELWTVSDVARKLGYGYHGARLVLGDLGVTPIHGPSGRVFYNPDEVMEAIENNPARLGAQKEERRGRGRPPGTTAARKDSTKRAS